MIANPSPQDCGEEESAFADFVAFAPPVTLIALLAGALFQIVATLIADARSGPFDPVAVQQLFATHDSYLLVLDHTFADFGLLLAHNLLTLSAFVIGGLLLSGWTPGWLDLRRWVGATISAGLVGFMFVKVVQQSTDLMKLFPPSLGPQSPAPSHLLLLRCLPHGPLEFAALLLPLIAALYPAVDKTHRVIQAIPISVLLLVAAAGVESWVSPELLHAALFGWLH
jgi:hypothetical protein